jgi:hypothetical protein
METQSGFQGRVPNRNPGAGLEPAVSFTSHARDRCRSRGIAPRLINAILTHADIESPVGSGCECLMLSRRRLCELRDGTLSASDRERLANVAVIVAGDGAIITAMHLDRLRSRRYRHGFN